jgi:hypothetical protein
MKARQGRSARGYSLIEMLLVMTGLALLFGVSVGTIHMLLRLDRGNRARLGETATVSRLARQFRHDVHAATSAQRDGKGLVFRLLDGRNVEYVTEGGRLMRVEARAAETVGREVFRMPSRGSTTWDVREDGGRSWAIMVLEPAAHAKDIVPPRPVRIEALVGKEARLAHREEAKR